MTELEPASAAATSFAHRLPCCHVLDSLWPGMPIVSTVSLSCVCLLELLGRSIKGLSLLFARSSRVQSFIFSFFACNGHATSWSCARALGAHQAQQLGLHFSGRPHDGCHHLAGALVLAERSLLQCCLHSLQDNGIEDPNALVGVESSDLEFAGGVKAGVKGLVRSLLRKANTMLASAVVDGAAPPSGTGDAGAIRALVDAVAKQQTTIKVELGPRIKVWLHCAFCCRACAAPTCHRRSP